MQCICLAKTTRFTIPDERIHDPEVKGLARHCLAQLRLINVVLCNETVGWLVSLDILEGCSQLGMPEEA